MKISKANILIVVCGGISAYKAPSVVSAFKKNAYAVAVMPTPSALNFVTPMSLAMMADYYWDQEVMEEPKEGSVANLPLGHTPTHIYAAQWCDICLVLSATANFIAKMAHGICDDIPSSTVIALPEQKLRVMAPAMNTHMWNNPVVRKNVEELDRSTRIHPSSHPQYYWNIVHPVEGKLACGTTGIGALAPTRAIVDCVKKWHDEWDWQEKSNV